jgi:nucleoside diphosphate kinase
MSDQRLLGISASSDDAHHSSTPTPTSPLVNAATRTVAIIKPHAVDHRFEIEHRITEAKFEILKERQMEFDMDTDPDALFELFGEDARSFAEGPVWVYVLERRRAIEVWNTIMGDADPQLARQVSPNSLRALYGINNEQNAVMGSPDVDSAEIQIASLFVSSPPFPTSALPDDYSTTDGLGLGHPDALTAGSLRFGSTHFFYPTHLALALFLS